jgi:hypothetical protein
MLAKLIKMKISTNKLSRETTYFSHPILQQERITHEDGQGVRNLKGEGTLVLSRVGYCLPYTRNIKKLNTNKLVQIWLKSSQKLSFNVWSYLEYAMISNDPLSHSDLMVKNELYDASFIHDFRIESKRIYLPKRLGLALINGKIKMRKDILDKLRIEKELDSMVCIFMNNPPIASIDDSFFESENGMKVDTLIEIFIKPKKFRKYSSYNREKIETLNKFVEEVLDKCLLMEFLFHMNKRSGDNDFCGMCSVNI